MKKNLLRYIVPAVALSMAMPFIAAARDSGSSAPVQYTSWVKAVDENGDKNAIGKFNSNNTNKKLYRFNGTVTAVSATSISVKRTNSDATVTTKTFAVTTSTGVIRKFKGTSSIAEVMVGDTVQVWATASTNGTAKLIWDKSIWWVALKGVISNLDATNKTFSLTVSRKEPETGLPMTMVVPITTSDKTTYWMGTTAKAFTDLANGQTVNVRGSFDAVAKSVWASKVTISS